MIKEKEKEYGMTREILKKWPHAGLARPWPRPQATGPVAQIWPRLF